MLIELPGGGTRLGGTSGPTRRFRLGEHVFFGSLFTSCQKVTLSKSFFFGGGNILWRTYPVFGVPNLPCSPNSLLESRVVDST